MALAWLHQYIYTNIISSYPRSSKILILWSGTWAFDNVLLKEWFTNIYSCDYYTNNLVADKVRFSKLDFNKNNFGEELIKETQWKFDIIISIEIIEHLYSSYNFLANTQQLLNTNWVLILSTPNMHSFLSRIDNLITWYPTFFIQKPWIGDHVNPIFDNILEHYCDLLKLQIHKKYSFGSIRTYLKTYQKESFRSYIYIFVLITLYYILQIFMIINRKHNSKIVSIYKIMKKN